MCGLKTMVIDTSKITATVAHVKSAIEIKNIRINDVIIPTQYIDLNNSKVWFDKSNSIPHIRNGKDIVIELLKETHEVKFRSQEDITTTPFKSDNFVIGGFHCLCKSSYHSPKNKMFMYLCGDIIPQSIWTISHRPMSLPFGMVYDPHTKMWVDIYLNSLYCGEWISKSNAKISPIDVFDKLISPKYKRCPTYVEFLSFLKGSPKNKPVDTTRTGGNFTVGVERIISDIGCEDCTFTHIGDQIRHISPDTVPTFGQFLNNKYTDSVKWLQKGNVAYIRHVSSPMHNK